MCKYNCRKCADCLKYQLDELMNEMVDTINNNSKRITKLAELLEAMQEVTGEPSDFNPDNYRIQKGRRYGSLIPYENARFIAWTWKA